MNQPRIDIWKFFVMLSLALSVMLAVVVVANTRYQREVNKATFQVLEASFRFAARVDDDLKKLEACGCPANSNP